MTNQASFSLAVSAMAGLVSGLACRPTDVPTVETPVDIPNLEPTLASPSPTATTAPRRVQRAEPQTIASDRSCCKGHNDCKAKGNCKIEGANECKGLNECKGKGGCKPADCSP